MGIYLLKGGKVKVPVTPQVFKYGGGINLIFANHERGVHIPLMGNAEEMVAELAELLERIRTAVAVNDQAYISRTGHSD